MLLILRCVWCQLWFPSCFNVLFLFLLSPPRTLMPREAPRTRTRTRTTSSTQTTTATTTPTPPPTTSHHHQHHETTTTASLSRANRCGSLVLPGTEADTFLQQFCSLSLCSLLLCCCHKYRCLCCSQLFVAIESWMLSKIRRTSM